MVAPRSTWQFVSAVAACCWLAASAPAGADSILAGAVTDVITKLPVVGAEVRIEYSGQAVGTGTTDIDGLYRAPFTIPSAAPAVVTMTATAQSRGHEVNQSNFQVRNGTPVETAHNIALFPLGTTACVGSRTGHSVIVGYFLPPGGQTVSDLSRRVAQSLEFALSTRLQTVHLSTELQPSFEPCDAAKPRTPKLAASYAKALRADAYVGGDIAIAGEPSSFTVSTYVSDAHDLFSAPVIATNKSVDLRNPLRASETGETHAAVLAAIAAGLANKDNCVAAIAVLSVAERVVNPVPPYISGLRRKCEARVPNAGLASP